MNRNVLTKLVMVFALGLGAFGAHQGEAAGYGHAAYALGDTYPDFDAMPPDLTVVADADQYDNTGDPYYDDPYTDWYDQPIDSGSGGGSGPVDTTPPPVPCDDSCGGSFPLCDATLDRCYRNGTNGEWRWRVDDWEIRPDPDLWGNFLPMCTDDAALYCDSSEYPASPQRFNYSGWHECHEAGHSDLTGQVNYVTTASSACCSYGASSTNGRCYAP